MHTEVSHLGVCACTRHVRAHKNSPAFLFSFRFPPLTEHARHGRLDGALGASRRLPGSSQGPLLS
jgi:hypothetical protein